MTVRVLSLLLLCLMGCSPLVTVVREERPLIVLAPEAQPVVVVPFETGFVLLDFLNLFSSEHARDHAAAKAVADALGATGVIARCEEPCPQAHTTLMAGLDRAEVSAPDQNGAVTARIGLVVQAPGDTRPARIDHSRTLQATPEEALRTTLTEAAQRYAADYAPSEQSDTFRLADDKAFEASNTRLIEGEPLAAAQLLQTHLATHPDDVAAWSNLSVALTAAGDLDGAAQAAHTAAQKCTTGLKLNYEQQARQADRRRERTTKVLSFSTIK